MKNTLILTFITIFAFSCASNDKFDVKSQLDYCVRQLEKSLPELSEPNSMPRNILSDSIKKWQCTSIYDWTSGFWPGILWYAYEYTHNENLEKQAKRFSEALYPVADRKADNHDLGFMIYCSLGNGYRLTNDSKYKEILLRAADSLAVLYHPTVGTIDSWPGFNEKMSWHHNTIIDNMLNLELLFWAAKNGGNPELYNIASRHAETTMKNHFRDDFSTYHVVAYDTITGQKVANITHQGFADNSMWARGQAWAIYGFTMSYRETKNPLFLETAQKAADTYLANLPFDLIPYWDFNASGIPNEPRDASAAAIVASALLELSEYTKENDVSGLYKEKAVDMLKSLSSEEYLCSDRNNAFLRHVTGHKPNNSEVDVSIIYADYYYIEALLRLKKIEETGKLF